MNFSQRVGITPASKQLQIDSIDDDLRNGLWDAVKIGVIDPLEPSQYATRTDFKTLCVALWHNLYKLPIDTMPSGFNQCKALIRKRFFNYEWYETYNFLEFVANINPNSVGIDYSSFKNFCNRVLKREFSGYRFINDSISPITNDSEISEIEKAIEQAGSFTALQGANIHLKSALGKLSDRKTPDYRNSIKESISAIEAVSKVISGNNKDSLGGAFNKIKDKIKIHPSLERGFRQLYGYTSDGDGIRHALMDTDSCDFEDAKYMLVSCSAFINYLIAKAQKAGIENLSDK